MILTLLRLGALLFVLTNTRHVILLLMWVEARLLVRNRSLLLSSAVVDDFIGLVMARRVLTVAAAEATIGLGLRLAYYRVFGVVGRRDRNRLQT